MSNYDALASFLLLFIPLAAVVQLLIWWFCPVDDAHDQAADISARRAEGTGK